MSDEPKPLDQGPIVHATSLEMDYPAPEWTGFAQRKDIGTLDAKLTAEIRRQTCYLLLGLARLASVEGAKQLVQLTADYENACDEADKK